MLKKKLGLGAIERDWDFIRAIAAVNYFKTPSTLIIPEGCKKIGFAAFCNCWRLKKVIIPEGVEVIGGEAFYRCGRATIILRKKESKFTFIAANSFLGVRDVRSKSWWKRLALFWNNIFKKIC